MNPEVQTNPEQNQEQQIEKPVKLKPLPFNITPDTRERFQALFPKSTDQTLNALLDAYEAQQNATTGSESELSSQIADLKKKLNAAQEVNTTLKNQVETLKAQPKNSDDSQRIQDLQSEISEKSQKIAELKAKITEKENEISTLTKQVDDSADVQKLKQEINQLKDQQKEDKKLLEGRADQKKAFDEKIDKLEKENKDKQKKIDELIELVKTTSAGKYTHSDEFLGYFEPIVAELLSMTALKLTESRKDGMEITPSMILGDMFLKYTLQKRTMWFYKWVLYDSEILEAAQSINPNITSIRMLRRVLNVDQELN